MRAMTAPAVRGYNSSKPWNIVLSHTSRGMGRFQALELFRVICVFRGSTSSKVRNPSVYSVVCLLIAALPCG